MNWRVEGSQGRVSIKGHEDEYGGDEYVSYLDCGDGFLSVQIHQNIKLCTLNIFHLLYVI